MTKISTEERFARFVDGYGDFTTCWLWLGARDPNEYGVFTDEAGIPVKAHRFSWFLHYDMRLQPTDRLLNRCETYGCINPTHWILSTPENRFWEKVDKKGPTMPHMKTNCWVWTASKGRDGYGTFIFSSKYRKAHVASYMIHNGAIPSGLHVCHACDNPPCVRPDHLWLGTNRENTQDKVDKGRHGSITRNPVRGEDSNFAILTVDEVLQIKDLLADGNHTQKVIADQFNVSSSLISMIRTGKRWNHIGRTHEDST